MEIGVAMICTGYVRVIKVQNKLLKNFPNARDASLGFYIVGYTFAFGKTVDRGPTTLLGSENFFLVCD